MQYIKTFLIAFVIWSFVLVPFTAWAEETERPSAGIVAFDASVVRILGTGTTILGGAIYVVTLPFTYFVDDNTAWEVLVVDPFEFTFYRPLGDFDKDWKHEMKLKEKESEG